MKEFEAENFLIFRKFQAGHFLSTFLFFSEISAYFLIKQLLIKKLSVLNLKQTKLYVLDFLTGPEAGVGSSGPEESELSESFLDRFLASFGMVLI